ncbi:hypothetical protein PP175_28910 (plasmid) [Aneurinibacillus sp. Ricciae_BoGa-3]|uniref:hypothetical protein n=1 Tax=Aneurinibacillus sp. Ricciae_BoGa-3 TaxID=3022697 RepID=UPI002341DB7E|nr:hypothetical protein [Aneurinibacillus sp. Ricciae_BoGa-3]WCK57212.1 hypothetical protein PP175_28910 [Aneurinibacillus sp. Ricciae_BoGa-3]
MRKSKLSNNHRNKSKWMTSLLSTTFLTSSILSVHPVYASLIDHPSPYISSNVSVQNLKTVRPDMPISFIVSSSTQSSNSVYNQIKQGAKVGVLITDGMDFYLATSDNQMLTRLDNGNAITLNANHIPLKRNTKYTAHLLVGNVVTNYQAQSSMSGYAQLFTHIDNDAVTGVQFLTGSEVGEASNWKATLSTNSPIVTDGATITLRATDDYGNTASEGTVSITDVKTLDNTSLSDTFHVLKSVSLLNGVASIPISNHKAQAVSITLQTKGKYESDSKTITLNVFFKAGKAVAVSMVPDRDTFVAGAELVFKGELHDQYGNPLKNSDVTVSFSDGGVSKTGTTDENGQYLINLNAPSNLDPKKGTTQSVNVSLLSNGNTISTQTITLKPDEASQVTVETQSVIAGKTTKIIGFVKDQYGNTVLPITIDVYNADGKLLASPSTDYQGRFSFDFIAPDKLKQNVGGSESMTLTFTYNHGKTDTATIDVRSDGASNILFNPVGNITPGKSVELSGSVVDGGGNRVTDDTDVTIWQGAKKIDTVTAKEGKFTKVFTPLANQTYSFTASIGNIKTKSPLIISTMPQFIGSYLLPANIDDPTRIIQQGKVTDISKNKAFFMPSTDYSSDTFVPFYYWSQLPVMNPNGFNKQADSIDGALWLTSTKEAPNHQDGMALFKTNFTLDKASTVKFSMPSVNGVAIAYVDNQPVVYNNGIKGMKDLSKGDLKLPSNTATLSLNAGTHTIVLEASKVNAQATGIKFDAVNIQDQKSIASTNPDTKWTTTGYISEPLVGWYDTANKYTIYQELLHRNSLNGGAENNWILNVTE